MNLMPEIEAALTERTDADFNRFQAMMADTERRAYSMALQLTRNSSDAEDLVQDTFVKAWRGFDSYMPGRPFLNWLLRIMQRAYLDSRRRDNPIRKAESLNSMISPSDGEVQELPIADEGPGPDDEALYDEFRHGLREALNELPEVYRTRSSLRSGRAQLFGDRGYAEHHDRNGPFADPPRTQAPPRDRPEEGSDPSLYDVAEESLYRIQKA